MGRGETRIRCVVATALAALLIGAVAAPAASGRVYRTTRPGFDVRIHFHHAERRVVRVDVHFLMHCRNGTQSNGVTEGFGAHVRRDGRFRFHFRARSLGFAYAMVGRLGPRRVSGRWRFVQASGRCHTGSSRRDPWIHFVARRR